MEVVLSVQGNVGNAEKLGFKRHGVSENMTQGMWPQV